MEIFPLYNTCHPQWARRSQYNSQLIRDLAAALLSEALSSSACNRQTNLPNREPVKWKHTLELTNFHPDEVKVSVNDDTIKIHAKHVIGDESDFDSYEVRREIKIPENVDNKKISVKMNNNGNLVIEGPINSPEKKSESTSQTAATSQNVCVCKNESDKEENNTETQETKDTEDFKISLNLANFEPSDVSVTCEDNILKVQAKSEHKENGFESSRYFYRECTLPQNVEVSDIKCTRGDDGKVSIRLPHVNKKSITTTQNKSECSEADEKDVTIKDERAIKSNDTEEGDGRGEN